MAATTAEHSSAPGPDKSSKGEIAKFQPPRLPYHPAIEERFGVAPAEWKALVEAIFPLAQSVDSVVLALSYCKARNLDPFKRVVHIVPIYDRNYVAPGGKRGRMVDTIWPGIGELRTTAFRTKQYAGADACEFGPIIDRTFTAHNDDGTGRNINVSFPEWAQLTVYRMIDGQRVPIPGPRVYWLETYSRMGRTEIPNEMWQKRPIGQLEKCAEASALRRAFPEELGDDHTNDEAGVMIGPDAAKDVTPRPVRSSQPADPAPGEPFVIAVPPDGTERTFDDPKDAADAFLAMIGAADSHDTLDALWESNTLSEQLRDRGRADLGDAIATAHTAALAIFEKETSEEKTMVPEPPDPKNVGDLKDYVPALAAWLSHAPQDALDAHLARNKKWADYIRVNREKDQQSIDEALDARRHQDAA